MISNSISNNIKNYLQYHLNIADYNKNRYTSYFILYSTVSGSNRN